MDMMITFPGNKKVDSTYKGFTVHTDQPIAEGGENTAPEPFDLFLASIGTCAGIYVSSFCKERQIDTADLFLILSFIRNAATHMVERIDIQIKLPSGFPEKYKSAVIRTAEMCFVKKHLSTPPQFCIFTSTEG
ncbi:MAG: OsmC family protein [Deltaproteobacteria bacterium]|nr:OsmC family protein [Deltaproteobacteria bacterium]